MTVNERKVIYLANGYLVRQELRIYDAATDRFIAWTSQPATVTFATDELGANPITGLTSLSLTASGATAGVYYATLTAAQVNNLTAYAGQVVYQITVAGSSNQCRVVLPVLVVQPRLV